jgi:hypothetical protein
MERHPRLLGLQQPPTPVCTAVRAVTSI